jgi:2-C-methyl-D-erythritol 4-phosphate cytidylyltransferase
MVLSQNSYFELRLIIFTFDYVKQTFIITAGGIGKRMNSSIPKQFILLDGKPILMRTIEVFYSFNPQAQLLLTLPKDWWEYWVELCNTYSFSIKVELIEGGIERYDSIKNALSKVTGELVAIHDGVRPLVSIETIESALNCAAQNGSAVPVVQLKESLRQTTKDSSAAVDRSQFYLVQTPQCFQLGILRKAYELPFSSTITDDASLVEKSGAKIHLTEGNEENIKITTPSDLKIAEALISS